MSSQGAIEERRTNLVVAGVILAALTPGLLASAAQVDLPFFERSHSSVSSCTAAVGDPTYCSQARDDSVVLPSPVSDR